MGRWEPNAQGRLQQAAFELFREHGYDGTTVQEIAARAGLTERTFFRYYADKREVLFAGSAELQRGIVEAIASAPAEMTPLELISVALDAGARVIPRSRELARARWDLIVAHGDLQERELIKLTAIGSAVAEALRARGVGEPAASLTAEAGIAVLKVGFATWVQDTAPHDLAHHLRAALSELTAVVAGGPMGTAPKPRRARRAV